MLEEFFEEKKDRKKKEEKLSNKKESFLFDLFSSVFYLFSLINFETIFLKLFS
jgi:hypothetical protein